MKLRPDQLDTHLKKSLLPVYLLTGDDVFLMQEARSTIRQQAVQHQFNEYRLFTIEQPSDWQDLTQALYTYSLFDDKRFFDIRLPSGKPGDQGIKCLKQLAATSVQDTCIVISTPKLDANSLKSSWVKAIDAIGVIMQIWPIKPTQLPFWLKQRLNMFGLTATPGAIDLLVDHVQGNLLAAAQEIEKLRLLNLSTITETILRENLVDNSEFSLFELVDACLQNDMKQALRIFEHLKAEGTQPILILWALAKQCRELASLAHQLQHHGLSMESLLAKSNIWQQRKPLIKKAFNHHSLDFWEQKLKRAHQIDKILKGVLPGNAWFELLRLVQEMAGLNYTLNYETLISS